MPSARARLRARITLVGGDTVAVTLMDDCGALVGRMGCACPARHFTAALADEDCRR